MDSDCLNLYMLTSTLALSITQLASLVTYLPYGLSLALNGKLLDSQSVFLSLSILRLFTQPLLTTVQYTNLLMQTSAALERIHEFLSSKNGYFDSLDDSEYRYQPDSKDWESSEPNICLSNLEFEYDGEQPIFSGLDFEIERKSFTVLLGRFV
jgi:ATP-binding cassette, subfamily C (CFTR/MRP), member 1